jgi:hypothetical protein
LKIPQNLRNLNIIELKDSEQTSIENKPNSGRTETNWFQQLTNSLNGQIRFTDICDPTQNCTAVNTIDIISRYLFPITFVICIVIYLFYIYLF